MMQPELNFQQLLEKAKAGDGDAATELFNRYKDAIRRTARMHTFSARQRRLFDSEDILQTVMKSFFTRVGKTNSQWKLDTPENLINLLLTMAKNKVVSKSRKLDTKKRGGDSKTNSNDDGDEQESREKRPDELAEINELARKCWDRIPGDIRGLYRLRFEEQMSWDEIGEELDESGEACRKRLVRSLKEVAKQFPDH